MKAIHLILIIFYVVYQFYAEELTIYSLVIIMIEDEFI